MNSNGGQATRTQNLANLAFSNLLGEAFDRGQLLDELGENIGKSHINPGIIGAVEDLQAVVEREKIDCVILAITERREKTPVRQLLDLKFVGVAVEDANSILEEISGRIYVECLPPSSLIPFSGV